MKQIKSKDNKMFCPNCGTELDESNYKFCPHCGYRLSKYSKPSNYDQSPYQTKPENLETAIYKNQVSLQNLSNSKRCFFFGLFSFILPLILFMIGFFLFHNYLNTGQKIFRPENRLIIFSIFIFHVIGLIFGIISRNIYNRIPIKEGENSYKTAGRVFGTLGIILNVIGLFALYFAYTYRTPYYT